MRSNLEFKSAAVAKPMPLEATASEPQSTASQLSVVDEATSEHEKIARLAYSYWEERGCPEGSPELDWLQAEQVIRLSKFATPVDRETDTPGSSQTMAKSA